MDRKENEPNYVGFLPIIPRIMSKPFANKSKYKSLAYLLWINSSLNNTAAHNNKVLFGAKIALFFRGVHFSI